MNGFIGLHSCSGRQWGPQCLAVLVVAPKADKGRDSTNTWLTVLLHVKLESIIEIWIRCVCERFHRVAFIFRPPTGALVPWCTCFCTYNWQRAKRYDYMTNCSPISEPRKYHSNMDKECVWTFSEGCIHVQAANGGLTALLPLLLHQKLTMGEILRIHDQLFYMWNSKVS